MLSSQVEELGEEEGNSVGVRNNVTLGDVVLIAGESNKSKGSLKMSPSLFLRMGKSIHFTMVAMKDPSQNNLEKNE